MKPSVFKIRIYGDNCLRKKSSPVVEVGPGELMLINSMLETMYDAKGVGLAAPQIGINQQIFVIDIGEGPHVFVNPRITKKQDSGELEEGCLSIPDVLIIVNRPQKILVKFMDENNQWHEKAFEDLMARVIQHETDHLHGKMIVDFANREEKKKYKEQLVELERNNDK